ncbi:heme-binding protein [Mycobacterium deserti]|uniref:Heme-binding protein n=1 Tax=Mycobacterium deserti TaxID=2978347 RepID=A0ABT2MF75_9MYCO|nr:heme-binding protein [Mycobacterium deserti]MCT7660936.1 heme-binding protein [Mycobacterium deserti]
MPNVTTRHLSMTLLAGVAAVAALCAAPLANATGDPAVDPPHCTTADLQGVQAGVDASASAYLFTHPDLNGFMSTLGDLSREQVATRVDGYMATHPQEDAEMNGIRQPLVDMKNRCGTAVSP